METPALGKGIKLAGGNLLSIAEILQALRKGDVKAAVSKSAGAAGGVAIEEICLASLPTVETGVGRRWRP